MKMTNKLYLVTLRGFGGFTTGVDYKTSYVVAPDTETAYQMVKKFLDDRDWGFHKDRVLDSIQLLAEEYENTGTKVMLFIHGSKELNKNKKSKK